MPKKPVRLYSLSTCAHCKATKRLLDECTIQYEFTDVDLAEGIEREKLIEDVKAYNPKCTFPTIIIGDRVVVGYNEKKIRKILGID